MARSPAHLSTPFKFRTCSAGCWVRVRLRRRSSPLQAQRENRGRKSDVAYGQRRRLGSGGGSDAGGGTGDAWHLDGIDVGRVQRAHAVDAEAAAWCSRTCCLSVSRRCSWACSIREGSFIPAMGATLLNVVMIATVLFVAPSWGRNWRCRFSRWRSGCSWPAWLRPVFNCRT